jgi:RNA-directed DNA polymerase
MNEKRKQTLGNKSRSGYVRERQKEIVMRSRDTENKRAFSKAQKSRITSLAGRTHAVEIMARKKTSVGNSKMTRNTEEGKTEMVEWRGEVLNNPKGYKVGKAIKMEIPKPGTTKKRTFKIPTVEDRTLQMCYLMATDPVVEDSSDVNSFGFRKGRWTGIPVQRRRYQLGITGRGVADTVFETDIEKCFDKIAHEVILKNTPNRPYISLREKWLEGGATSEISPGGTGRTNLGEGVGTAQGSVVSPMRCNVALNGREGHIRRSHKYGVIVKIYRYADDRVRTVREPNYNRGWVRATLASFLADRGRNMKPSKTKVTKVEKGFDFLGWNIRKVSLTADKTINSIGSTIQRTASEDAVTRGKRIIRECVHKHNVEKDVELHFNRRVTGWCKYYEKSSHIKHIFHDRDVYTHGRLIGWSKDHGKNETEAYTQTRKFKTRRKIPNEFQKSCAYPSFDELKSIQEGLKKNVYRK